MFPILIFYLFPIFNGQSSNLSPEQENFTTEEFITYHGFPYEEHLVELPNGIISPLQRIPNGPSETYNSNRIPVLMYHGLLSSGKMWVAGSRNRSLAYILVDHGYDVWLANARGCFYSNSYNKEMQDSSKYWDFSFQELALIDTPLIVDYILSTTGHKKLFFIGISLGTSVAFSLLSTKTEYNDKIIALFGLSPFVYMKYSSNIFLLVQGFINEIRQQMLHNRGSLPDNLAHMIQTTLFSLCKKLRIFQLCIDFFVRFFGDRFGPEDKAEIPIFLTAVADLTSVKATAHYWQLHQSGKFQMYDYGVAEKNMKIYNQTSPREFNLSKVTIPVALFAAKFDNLGDQQDTETLSMKLPNFKFNSLLLNAEGDGHFTIVGSSRVSKVIYPKLTEIMKSISRNPEKKPTF